MIQSTKKIPSVKAVLAILVCGVSTFLPAAQAQTQDALPTPSTSAPSAFSLGGINFSGLVDGYYNFNANHPPNSSNGNQLRNFDYDANTFSLNMAKLTIARDPAPVGFRLDLGFGKAFNQILSTEPDFKHLEQAYVSWKPASGKGFEADFGEFVTSAGAEVIETQSNWNYSRSLLFSLAIPYYHVGLRTSMPITKNFTGGVQIVNGWNNFSDNNSGKTIGLTGAYAKPKFTLNMNYYVGPENNHTNKGYRNLLDTTLLLTPTSKVSAYINYDYGQNRNASAIDDSANPLYQTTTLSHWQGIATAVRYQATKKVAFASRYEYYKDESGFTTGQTQNLNEVTVTGEYRIPEGLLARLEYRRDNSDHLFFAKGDRTVHSQSTLEVGIVAFFGFK
ncbi:MAG TPA: porin [Edaphobacter sp.]|nr:porin [Edaphobacter sp.]